MEAGPFPPELSQERARTWGRAIASDYSRYEHLISLPILDKALAFIRETKGETLDGVLLFVSDQPEGSTAPENRDRDTLYLGQIIREHLARELFGGDKKKIFVRAIRANPADYDLALRFFQEELPQARSYCPPDTTFYLSLSGGTPAMNMMLLLIGVETFGPSCTGLYVSPQYEHPFPLAAVRSTYGRSVQDMLLGQLKLHSYGSTLALLQQNPWILDSEQDRELLGSLLAYARDRLAFDFPQTLAALQPALTSNHDLAALADEMREPSFGWKLRELYYNAEIKYQNGEYADFLGRVFRFDEAVMQYLAEKCGVVFEDESRQSLDSKWRKSEPELMERLSRSQGQLSPLDRLGLKEILRYFAERSGDKGLEGILSRSEPIPLTKSMSAAELSSSSEGRTCY